MTIKIKSPSKDPVNQIYLATVRRIKTLRAEINKRQIIKNRPVLKNKIPLDNPIENNVVSSNLHPKIKRYLEEIISNEPLEVIVTLPRRNAIPRFTDARLEEHLDSECNKAVYEFKSKIAAQILASKRTLAGE